MADFYDKIREDIKATRLTIAEFARQVGVSRDTVYNLSDKTAIGTYLKIIEVLGKKPSDYFRDPKYPNLASDLSLVHEEGEVYGVVNYKEKYFEALEKLNAANERILDLTARKKSTTKAKK